MSERAPERCILCGSQDREPMITIGPWTVQGCTGCGLGVLDPRPSAEELARLYDERYCKDRFVEGGRPGTPEFKRRLELETHRVRFFSRFKRGGTVLDIGCGYGYFLAACRQRGYGVHGLDFSDWAAGHARSTLELPVTVAPLSEVELPEKSFDVITLWHSLEHMADPREALQKAAQWLKPDGVLVVDVPNHDGTDARRQGSRWNGWDLPYHFFHFTPGTIERFLAGFGFRKIRQKTYHSETVKESLGRIPIVRLLARPVAKIFSGHSVALAARRKG